MLFSTLLRRYESEMRSAASPTPGPFESCRIPYLLMMASRSFSSGTPMLVCRLSETAQRRCSKDCNASARARFPHACHPRARFVAKASRLRGIESTTHPRSLGAIVR